ncbi:MAG TPA: hypothetical protein VN688_02000 [Gemmataceae bacterium]|nr:hypothetical protein [Gemmataceae bacterium]
MSNRKCQLFAEITNAAGITKRYFLRPLATPDLPTPFVAGFRLVNRTDNPAPIYLVRLAADGAVNCSCPQWQRSERCKHADALTAAGLLPIAFVENIRSLTGLLNIAEEKLAECDILARPAAQRIPRRKSKKAA